MEENKEKQEKNNDTKQGTKEPITAKTILQEKDEQEQAKKYTKYVEDRTPKPNLIKDMIGAFVVGGALCTLHNSYDLLLYGGYKRSRSGQRRTGGGLYHKRRG